VLQENARFEVSSVQGETAKIATRKIKMKESSSMEGCVT